jgi:hypothetical protein
MAQAVAADVDFPVFRGDQGAQEAGRLHEQWGYDHRGRIFATPVVNPCLLDEGIAEEAGVVVALHASDSGYQDYLNTWEGSGGAEYVAFRPKAFANVADGGRSIQDTLASAICHGMLTRFPGVKLLSVENGGSWVGPH